MQEHKQDKKIAEAPPEQIAYADILFYGCWFGIFVLLITYILYLTRVVPPYVPMEQLTWYWSHNVHHYVEEANVPTGWGWVKFLNKGDFLNFIGIAFLALLTIVGFLTLIPAYAKKKDWAFMVIVVVEILVLLLAATGILGTGGH